MQPHKTTEISSSPLIRLIFTAGFLISIFLPDYAFAVTEAEVESALTMQTEMVVQTADVQRCELSLTYEFPKSCYPNPKNRPAKQIIVIDLRTVGWIDWSSSDRSTFIALNPHSPSIRNLFRPRVVQNRETFIMCEGHSIEEKPPRIPVFTTPRKMEDNRVSLISEYISEDCD